MGAVSLMIAALACCAGILLSRRRGLVNLLSGLYALLQAGSAVWMFVYPPAGGQLFVYDALGKLFFSLSALVGLMAVTHSWAYLKGDTLREYKIYFAALILLLASLSGVYFAANAAVTWIFLEATTLSAAGLIYYHREAKSLEAAWKYVFVCSVGISMAYLGILLLSSVVRDGGDLTYANLAMRIATANPLYAKMAFLFILVGYSCKLEAFPLYAAGVDANSAAPAPAGAVISTALLNGGFVAVFRVYKVMMQSEFYPWMQGVLLILGVATLAVGALTMRRVRNYKRLWAYSSVENMGLVLIALGLGGGALLFAVLHLVGHTFLKSSLFFQLGPLYKSLGSYRIEDGGEYMKLNPAAGVGLALTVAFLLGFPPSVLFISELGFVQQAVTGGKWWAVAAIAGLVCVAIYILGQRVYELCFKPAPEPGQKLRVGAVLWSALAFMALACALGAWQPGWLMDLINGVLR